MSPDALAAIALFAAVTTGTPRTNNRIVIASSAGFGLRCTLPHVFGITGDIVVMLTLAGARIAGGVAALPWLPPVLAVAVGLYLPWLAWKVAAPSGPRADPGRPLTFLQAAGFQWVNIKT